MFGRYANRQISGYESLYTNGVSDVAHKLDLLFLQANDRVNEKPFKQLWCELASKGWKTRGPSDLSNNVTYVKPGVESALDTSLRRDLFFVGRNVLA